MKGKRLGNVTLGELLGEGGMGKVYAGRHETLDIDVAVKVLPENFANDEKLVASLLKEARSAAKINHPNAVRVYDCGEEDGTYYLVMERVDGKSCRDLITEKGKLPVEEAARYIADVAQALTEAAKHGIVHCDVKPANILVNSSGQAKISDLGIARVLVGSDEPSATGKVASGTPAYMAPEQAKKGGVVDHRSDIYGLGASFFHMVTGETLFEGAPKEMLRKHVKETPRPVRDVAPEVPEDVAKIIEKMLAKKQEDRYASTALLSDELRPLIGTDIQSLADLSKWFSSALKCFKTHVVEFIKAGAVIALIAGIVLLGMYLLIVMIMDMNNFVGHLIILAAVAALVSPLAASLVWMAATAMRDPLFKPELRHLTKGIRWVFAAALVAVCCEAANMIAGHILGTGILLFATAGIGILLKAFLYFGLCAAASGTSVFVVPFRTLKLLKDNYQAVPIVGLIGWLPAYMLGYLSPVAYVISFSVFLPLCCCLVARFCTVEREASDAPLEAEAGGKESSAE